MGGPRAKRSLARAGAAVGQRPAARMLGILKKEAPRWGAPVVTLISVQSKDPFRTLVGCVLSLRTKDEVTADAARRLFACAATPRAVLELAPASLERLIYPVGFYRTKARTIHGICRELIGRFGGRVPDTIEALLGLKGVGRKTANLVVTQAFRKPGICVDTHVHRISNRWGLVATKTPEATEMALRAVLPRRYWIDYNTILVAFGQKICRPVSPWCSRCPVEADCPKVGVARAR
jgi:endonuclease III